MQRQRSGKPPTPQALPAKSGERREKRRETREETRGEQREKNKLDSFFFPFLKPKVINKGGKNKKNEEKNHFLFCLPLSVRQKNVGTKRRPQDVRFTELLIGGKKKIVRLLGK